MEKGFVTVMRSLGSGCLVGSFSTIVNKSNREGGPFTRWVTV